MQSNYADRRRGVEETNVTSSQLAYASLAMRSIDQEIEDIARSDVKVLITGESGVGKDIVARRIHERSGRPGPFVTINCAGLPDSLLESELFGHVRGSFTGAFRDRRGWLDGAKGGTIFLDEIGEMSLRMQALLLRFVENGEIQRVGSDHLEVVENLRIVAATNRNLIEHVAAREFREDLYYRLNVIHVVVPPLRERPEDVVPLMEHFVDMFAAEYRIPRPVLAEPVLASLMAYSWPGNVRELRNIVERLVVRNRASVITLEELSAVMSTPGLPERVSASTRRETADVLYDRMVQTGESFWTVVHNPFTCHDLTRADLRAVVARGLEQTRGNYRSLLTLFNASAHDYKRFLNFLGKHGCRLSFHEYRTVPGPSNGSTATAAKSH
jgi:transcriptional regulator with GAF, ATPase, and Fis domain